MNKSKHFNRSRNDESIKTIHALVQRAKSHNFIQIKMSKNYCNNAIFTSTINTLNMQINNLNKRIDLLTSKQQQSKQQQTTTQTTPQPTPEQVKITTAEGEEFNKFIHSLVVHLQTIDARLTAIEKQLNIQ